MKVLVVYESMWGNTRDIAETIAERLGPDVPVIDVTQAPPQLPPDLDLLVVGGPTHAFSMSRDSTRRDAVQKGAPTGHESIGIREWLEALPAADTIDVATFDTRVSKVRRLPGSAAKAAGKAVRHSHLGRVVASESFYVDDMEGPLHEGELDHARAWAASLAGQNS